MIEIFPEFRDPNTGVLSGIDIQNSRSACSMVLAGKYRTLINNLLGIS